MPNTIVPGSIINTLNNSSSSPSAYNLGAAPYVLSKESKRKVGRSPVPTSPESFTDIQYKLKKGFTLGCDPEGFIFNKASNTPVPASCFIPGSKYAPHKVDKGAIQVDGMAAEFNIDPASTAQEWEDNIVAVLKQLDTFLPSDHEIRWVPSAEFAPEAFDKAPDECKELGCSPDFDAWTGEVNPPPHRSNPYLSVAGGHVHFGWTKDEDLSDTQHLINCQDLGKQLDFFLGAWGAYLDTDKLRTTLYGKMGAIRFKPYGMEYRVMSNFWVETPELRRAVWNRSCAAIDNMSQIFLPDMLPPTVKNNLQELIATHEKNSAVNQLAFPIMTIDTRHNRW